MARVAAAVTLLVGTAIRVDPRRTVAVLVLAPVTGALTALFGVGAQWTVDAAVIGRPAGIAAGVALFAVATVGGYVTGGVLSDLRSVLQHGSRSTSTVA